MMTLSAGCGLLVGVTWLEAAWLWLWTMGMSCRTAERPKPAAPCPPSGPLSSAPTPPPPSGLPCCSSPASSSASPPAPLPPPHLHQAHHRRALDPPLFGEDDEPGQQGILLQPQNQEEAVRRPAVQKALVGGRERLRTSVHISFGSNMFAAEDMMQLIPLSQVALIY